MGQVFGEDQKEIPILDNGSKVKPKATAFIHGRMEIDMKVNSKTALSTGKGLKGFSTVTPTKDSTKTGSLQGMVSIIGPLAVFSRGTSKRA
jgi:hypothetical protein